MTSMMFDYTRKWIFIVITTTFQHFSLITYYSVTAQQQQQQLPETRLVGIFDTEGFDFSADLFRYTIEILNEKNGFHDDDTIYIDSYSIGNSSCDGNVALEQYWKYKSPTTFSAQQQQQLVCSTADSSTTTTTTTDIADTLDVISSVISSSDANSNTNNNGLISCVIGARCSGASAALGIVAQLDNVAQISPTSTAVALEDLKTFSRLVAPDDVRGEVGALSQLLQHFGWSTVSLLSTNTPYATDLAAQFRSHWESLSNSDNSGNNAIAYSGTFKITGAMTNIDETVISSILDDIPVNDPKHNSRVILLAAHDQHAYEILRQVYATEFQPDTIWISLAWSGTTVPNDVEWLPTVPGFIGIRPTSIFNEEFMKLLQDKQLQDNNVVWPDLERHYAMSYYVDAITAAAMALKNIDDPYQRYNGTAVTKAIRDVQFDGLTGGISFDKTTGNRKVPSYNIVNLQQQSSNSNNFEWKTIGQVTGGESGYSKNSVSLDTTKLCLAVVGCNITKGSYPSDTYNMPFNWALVVVPLCAGLAIIAFGLYWMSHQQRKKLKERLAEIDNELEGIDDDADRAKIRKEYLIRKRFELQDRPNTWSNDVPETQHLVEVHDTDDQYWTVADQLRESMDDAHIAKLWRVQNNSLWSHYSFHKDRLKSHNVSVNEICVWHGTTNLDPSVIYNGVFDGFMIQYAADGFWGRGLYFAAKSAYSKHYSFLARNKPRSVKDRPNSKDDDHEMFLAKLIRGDEVELQKDKTLIVPPLNPKTQHMYNTVTGVTCDSRVWIVYENGRAYPDYLVRYYNGSIDNTRTKYSSKAEAMKHRKPILPQSSSGTEINCAGDAAAASTDAESQQQVDSCIAIWEFEDNTGWTPYSSSQQLKLEAEYQKSIRSSSSKWFSSRSSNGIVKISGPDWCYDVDIEAMTQTNTQHINHTTRRVQRRPCQQMVL